MSWREVELSWGEGVGWVGWKEDGDADGSGTGSGTVGLGGIKRVGTR